MSFDPSFLSVDPSALGGRIAALRHEHGWSQRRLALAAGVSHGYIALLELGRLPSPGKFRLDAVARALNLRTSDALLAPMPLPPSPSLSASSSLASPSPSPSASASRSRPEPHEAPRSVAAAHGRARPARAGLPPVAAALAEAPPPASAADQSLNNVLGALDELRASGARPLPVFRWGSCGDPRDRESPPDPDHLEFPPPGRETLIGPSGFGVMVKGDSMAGRGIYDGDVVWVNPLRPYQLGKVVLALITDDGGTTGMVVKTYARTDVGECLLSETVDGRSPVVCREFKVIGPVVGISSWRLPA